MRWTDPIRAAAVAFALVACGGNPQQSSAGAPLAEQAPAGSTPAAPAAAGAPAADTTTARAMPTSFEKAEGLAEDIQDDIQNRGWSAAAAKISGLRSLRDSIAATQAAQASLASYTRALDSLAAAVRSRSRYPALEAANHIGRTLNAMMARYATAVPIDVASMDVAGRDGLYDAQQGHWRAAGQAVAEMQQSYGAVRSHVKQKAPAVDGRITTELAAMRQAIQSRSASRFTAAAKRFLDDVDNVERMY